MAWQAALVLDEKTDISALLGWLPVWAWSSPHRRESADELRTNWGSLWNPEPALTLINTPIGDDPIEALIAEIPTLELHHFYMRAVRLFGLPNTPRLKERLRSLDYEFVSANKDSGLLFVRPLSELQGVQELEVDATGWKTRDDVYDAFFKAVGAPDWHGRSFDALNDSIGTGRINKVEVPYQIVVRNSRGMSRGASDFLREFASLIAELNANGCPVEMRIER
jgi:RNAse (barnase) inhibitor barstar